MNRANPTQKINGPALSAAVRKGFKRMEPKTCCPNHDNAFVVLRFMEEAS